MASAESSDNETGSIDDFDLNDAFDDVADIEQEYVKTGAQKAVQEMHEAEYSRGREMGVTSDCFSKKM